MVNPRWQALPHTDLPNLVRLGLALVVLDIDAGVAALGHRERSMGGTGLLLPIFSLTRQASCMDCRCRLIAL